MNLQYISDSQGKITGVYIPISEWNKPKTKYKGIDLEQPTISDWQIEEVEKRLGDLNKNPNQLIDFNNAMDEIEKEL